MEMLPESTVSYLICVENVNRGLSPGSGTIPLLGFRIFWANEEVESVIMILRTLPCFYKHTL